MAGISLNLKVNLEITYFWLLILLICKHGISLHLFVFKFVIKILLFWFIEVLQIFLDLFLGISCFICYFK